MKSHMENEHIARLIYKCIVGMTLLPEESAELEQWRKADPKHEETYRRLLDPRFLEREYRRMNAVDPVRPMADMQARIRKEMRPRRRMRWATTLAFVASLAAMFCIGYFWDRPLHEVSDRPSLAQQLKEASIVVGKTQAVLTTPGGEELALNDDAEHNMRLMADNRTGEKTHEARINKLTTPRGGEFKITLEDSTEVWLNAESQLIYPESFTESERRVTVRGEAYFKVAKDSLRPFYVESGDMAIRVYGTEFNINAYAEENSIYTTLVTGSIALRPLRSTKAELILTPGHQAIFKKDDHSTSVRSVDTKAVTSWHNGRFTFEEQTLEQIMRTLSRWYNFDYEFDDDHLAGIIFKGSAPRYAELSEVLSILEKSGGISFHVREEKIIITTD